MSEQVDLAKNAIEQYIKNNKIILLSKNLSDEFFNTQAGVFVSIHNKKEHSLRGCIGTFKPVKKCIGEEIIANAIAAATEDLRFMPIAEDELDALEINVDVLGEMEQVDKESELNPKKYGIYITTKDGRSALLLPDLEGVDTVQKQLEITRQKGGIMLDEKIKINRFEVKRYK